MVKEIEIWFEEYICDYCGNQASLEEGKHHFYHNEGWFALAPLSDFDKSKVFCCLDHLQAYLTEQEPANA